MSSRRASVSSASKRVDEKRKEGVATSPLPSKAPSPSLLTSLFTGVYTLLTDWDYFPWLSYTIIALEALLGLAIIFIARASIDELFFSLLAAAAAPIHPSLIFHPISLTLFYRQNHHHTRLHTRALSPVT